MLYAELLKRHLVVLVNCIIRKEHHMSACIITPFCILSFITSTQWSLADKRELVGRKDILHRIKWNLKIYELLLVEEMTVIS